MLLFSIVSACLGHYVLYDHDTRGTAAAAAVAVAAAATITHMSTCSAALNVYSSN
jgi:predicted aconitase with swiveling domain